MVTFGPNLVANISSDFHHLVNTGLAVGSLVKRLPIKVANHSKIDKFEWFIARPLWLHPIVITFNTLCLVKFYIQWCGAIQWTRWRSYFKQLICSCLASLFSGKATKLGSPPNFPKLIWWRICQSQYFITLLLEPYWTYFFNITYIIKKTPKLVAKILATKFGFVPDWLAWSWPDYCWVHAAAGFSPLQHQPIAWTNANLLSIGPFEKKTCEIWIKIQNGFIREMWLNMWSLWWAPFVHNVIYVNFVARSRYLRQG